MDGNDRRELLRATELVKPFNLDVPTACALFAEAAHLVGAHAVVAAAKAHALRSPASRERLALAKAADDYFDAKEAKGRSTRLLTDIRSRIGKFVADHPGRAIGEFTTAGIQGWIDRLRRQDRKAVSAQTRRNFATILGGFFEHYRRRGVIAENPCRDLERESDRGDGDVEYWKPDEADALLRAASPEVLPALVVGLFAGVRTAELTRLRWRDIDLDQRHVEIKAGTAKTRSRRLAPLSENAIAWLRPRRGEPDSPIYGEHPTTLPKRITEAAEAAGVRRIANGARHSWFTFRCALTGDVARTALEGGNSPAVVHSHYRGLATAADATRFFEIRPATNEGVELRSMP
jgi:integrase